MLPSVVRQYLDDPDEASSWLSTLGVEDADRGHANLVGMATRGITLDLMAGICRQLEEELPALSDPEMALNNLDRFVEASRNPLALGALFERDATSLPTLLAIFSSSQYLSDLLIRDPESYDLLRITEGAPVAREALVEDLVSEIDTLPNDKAVMTALRRFKERETLRTAYGDIIRGQTLETVTRQISYTADAIVEAALRRARATVGAKFGVPRTESGAPARLVVLAMGKLGGMELNYSSDIDLVMLFDEEGKTDGSRGHTNGEFFVRVARELVRLLSETTEQGAAYRVDVRLRPGGSQGPLVGSLESFLHYYDLMGRTWERPAYVKARPIAGDLDLGEELLALLTPWIYRRYLSRADITGIKSLKRKIEHKAAQSDADARDVKTGHGGIRDIEFVIQFLQLLNGGTLPEVRTGNTLDAIGRLEQAGCLTFQEREILDENYRFLRKVEHRLQIMLDLQTHALPSDEEGMRKLAIRMGYKGTPHRTALDAFRSDLEAKTALNRKILDHLLHDAFGEEGGIEPEVDLVNDPDPGPDRIEEVLSQYPFDDRQAAYRNLMAVATERIPFLSTRRCRHFLAAIAPQLLESIATTPDPDATLVNLSQVSDSLGGKGVLWELFSASRPSLELYVRLCAAAPYLASILTSNPGMIDELMDSLLLEGLPGRSMLERALADLMRGAENIDPILHSFKDAQHLRVGVRDLLGRDDIRATHATLSDIAEVCLTHIARSQMPRLVEKFGVPTIDPAPTDEDADREPSVIPIGRDGQPCELVILALGKLGGREPNYHSDLDVVFLYEADGHTAHEGRSKRDNTTTNQHFFSELGQRIIKIANKLGPYGRLFEVDPRLRPTGKSGSLAVPLDEFRRYFASGQGQLWERQSLCKARVIFGSPAVRDLTMQLVAEAAYGPAWRPESAREIHDMRARLEATASPRNIKRGPGGTVDIEFMVQMLQLRHGGDEPEVRAPGTLPALDALHAARHLSTEDYKGASHGYRFLRSLEARIRLMNSAGRHELPTDPAEQAKLAYLLECPDAATLLEEADRVRADNRARFERIFAEASR